MEDIVKYRLNHEDDKVMFDQTVMIELTKIISYSFKNGSKTDFWPLDMTATQALHATLPGIASIPT